MDGHFHYHIVADGVIDSTPWTSQDAADWGAKQFFADANEIEIRKFHSQCQGML